MSERLRVAFLAGCLFVIGLHLKTAGRLIVDGWRGPYAGTEVVANSEAPTTPEEEIGAAHGDDVALGSREGRDDGDIPGW